MLDAILHPSMPGWVGLRSQESIAKIHQHSHIHVGQEKRMWALPRKCANRQHIMDFHGTETSIKCVCFITTSSSSMKVGWTWMQTYHTFGTQTTATVSYKYQEDVRYKESYKEGMLFWASGTVHMHTLDWLHFVSFTGTISASIDCPHQHIITRNSTSNENPKRNLA